MASENQRGEPVAAPSDPVAPATAPPRDAKGKARATDARASNGGKRATVAPHVQPRREDRRKEYERRRRQWLYTRIGLGAFALLVVAGIGYGLFTWIQDEAADRPDGTVEYSYAGGNHTADLSQTVPYSESPPVGGDHA